MGRAPKLLCRRAGLLIVMCQDAGHRRPGDAVSFGDLAQAQAAVAILADGVPVKIERPPSEAAAFQPGAAHSGTYALDDEIAFQLRNRSDDGDKSPAQRAAAVQGFAVADELDAEVVEFVQHLQEVTGG